MKNFNFKMFAVSFVLSLALLLSLSSCGGKDGANGINGLNGSQGVQGVAGVDGDPAIINVIDPCGDAANIIDEVLLILSNGQVLSSMSDNANGLNTRLVLIPPGTYHTTDGSNCQFTVDAGGNVGWTM